MVAIQLRIPSTPSAEAVPRMSFLGLVGSSDHSHIVTARAVEGESLGSMLRVEGVSVLGGGGPVIAAALRRTE